MSITVREMLNMINKKLKDNYDTPVVRKSNGTYDMDNGRSIIEDFMLGSILFDLIGKNYFFHACGKKIRFSSTPLCLKLQFKPFDPEGSSPVKTLVKVIADNEFLLDETLADLLKDIKTEEDLKIERSKAKYNDFLGELNKHGLTYDEYLELEEMHTKVDFYFKKKEDILEKTTVNNKELFL